MRTVTNDPDAVEFELVCCGTLNRNIAVSEEVFANLKCRALFPNRKFDVVDRCRFFQAGEDDFVAARLFGVRNGIVAVGLIEFLGLSCRVGVFLCSCIEFVCSFR